MILLIKEIPSFFSSTFPIESVVCGCLSLLSFLHSFTPSSIFTLNFAVLSSSKDILSVQPDVLLVWIYCHLISTWLYYSHHFWLPFQFQVANHRNLHFCFSFTYARVTLVESIVYSNFRRSSSSIGVAYAFSCELFTSQALITLWEWSLMSQLYWEWFLVFE